MDNNALSPERIRARLGPDAPAIDCYPLIDSTNTRAKLRAAEGARHALLLAEAQSGGRGRRGRSFFSPAGSGLYMSYILPGDYPLDQAVAVTAYAAVCAAQAIEEVCRLSCGIKWVNDLYLRGKKVGGILAETVMPPSPGAPGALVVGLGINVRPCPVPEDLRETVGFLGCGEREELCAAITRRLARFSPRDRSYMDAYRARSIVLGRTVSFVQDGRAVSGRAEAITDDGGLQVALSGGVVTLHSGEISLTHIDGVK